MPLLMIIYHMPFLRVHLRPIKEFVTCDCIRETQAKFSVFEHNLRTLSTQSMVHSTSRKHHP